MDQIQTVQQFFCASLGRSLCSGNKHRGIDPSILSSGHHESWLFHKGCFSLNCCQTAILPHLGTLNSAYWALSTFQSSFIWAISFGCSMTLWSVHKGVPKQTCKNYLRRKQACNSWIKFGLYNNFAPALGGAFAMGTNTAALIQAYSVQAHHDCSTKAVFLWTAVKLQSCHILAHWTQHTGPCPPFNLHSFEQ